MGVKLGRIPTLVVIFSSLHNYISKVFVIQNYNFACCFVWV